MATRFGVDVGGTFTDLIFYNDETGEIRAAKAPTVAGAQEKGIAAVVADGVPPDMLPHSEYFLHGTTVGLNALLERRGAKVGLITTAGFRDVLELRRGDWEDPYNLFWKPADPLVPRHLRLEVAERVTTSGEVLTPLDEDDVVAAAATFIDEGVEAVAVLFLNAYVNPDHERRVSELLRKHGFEGAISLSHEVSGEHREYERTSTTVIDAYIRPIMGSYLQRLDAGLREMGFDGHKLVTRSGGGALTFSQAEVRPFETILSGPVAGAEGAAALARALNLSTVITADVGGTSFDTTLITDGRPPILHEGHILGMPVQTPWVDVRSIGAGGGSIARVDGGGLLRVGPHSAGAVPGPASYGRGGTEATVTDAAFYLGMLGHGKLASGLDLDRQKAEVALRALADRLGYTPEQTAQGILRIATVQMAEAIREITVEQGVDPRTAAIMPFGGAGPLFGTLLADELGVDTVVAPAFAGNFSAWGLLGADLAQSASRTRLLPLTDASLADVQRSFNELLLDLRKRPSVGELLDQDASAVLGIDMRYVGQEYSLTVSVPVEGERFDADAATVRKLFDVEYERAFGHSMDADVEVVAVRATVRTELPRVQITEAPARMDAGDGSTVTAYSFNRKEWMEFAVIDRAAIGESGIEGPAIIVEHTTTTYMDADYRAVPREHRALAIVRKTTEENQ
jgi:N-methylhydantoinase A